MSTRNVDLIFRVVDQATAELKGIRRELEGLQKLQGAYAQARQQAVGTGDDAQKVSKGWATGLGGVVKAVGAVGFAYSGIRQILGDTLQSGRGLYEYLIGANERLRAEILNSAANIASTQAVFKDGLKIEDPGEAIAALQPKLKAVLEQVQRDSVDLVGITGQELSGVFSILTSNVSKFSGQSKKITDPLDAAGALTLDFAAALGSIGVPLSQANQEINSILRSQISQDSVLSSQLGISNQMVDQWKAQGVLVDQLRSRLESFRSANAMGARSINGLTTNILDQLQLIGREAGEPLLEPIIQGLEVVYGFVQDNRQAFLEFTTSVIAKVIQIGTQLKDQLQPTFVSIVNSAKSLGTALAGLLPTVASTIQTTLTALTPILEIVEAIARVIEGVLSTEIGKTVVQAGLLLAVVVPLGSAIATAGTIIANFIAVIPVAIGLLGGLQAAASGATAALVPMVTAAAAAAAPFIALAAAVGAIAVGFQALKIREANIALDELEGTTNQLSDEALKYSQQLKVLNDLEEKNGGLSAEQQKQKKALQGILIDLNGDIDAQIELLKNTTGATAEQNAEIRTQIALLERMKELTANQGLGNIVDIAARDLQQYGSSIDLQRKKFEDLQRVLSGGATTEEFEQKVRDFVSSSASLVASGAVTAEEAQRELLRLTTDSRLTLEDRQKAEQALSQVVQTESKNRQDAIANEIADIRESVENGTISRIEGERQVTEATKRQIQERLAAVNEEIARREAAGEDGSALDALRNQAESLTNELDSLAIESNKRLSDLAIAEGEKRIEQLRLEQKEAENLLARGEITRSEFEQRATDNAIAQTDARIQALNAALETAQGSERRKLVEQLQGLNLERERLAIEGAQKVQAAQLRELERSQDAALDSLRASETERITELERLRLKEPELAARIERQILQERQTGLQEALRLEQERLAFLENQSPLSGEAELERQDQIRASRQKTADLTLQLVQQEASLQRALSNEIGAEIDKRTSRITNALEQQTLQYQRQLELIRLASQAESTRLDLLNAQKNLVQSRGALEQSVFAIAAAATQDEQQKARIQEKAGQAKLAAKVRELEVDAQIFEIQEIQRKLELESEKIQARIAQIKSRAALAESQATAAKTLADPAATEAQKNAALLGVQAAQIGVVGADASAQLTDFKAETNDALSGLKREAFANQQQTELLNAQFDAAQSIADPGRRDRALDSLSRSAQQATGVNANPYVTVVGGGPMSKGQASPILENLTTGFNELFGGISDKLNGALESFKIEFSNIPSFDAAMLGAPPQSTKLTQVVNNISQVSFVNRIEQDSQRAQLDGIRQAIANDLSQLFTQAANASA